MLWVECPSVSLGLSSFRLEHQPLFEKVARSSWGGIRTGLERGVKDLLRHTLLSLFTQECDWGHANCWGNTVKFRPQPPVYKIPSERSSTVWH